MTIDDLELVLWDCIQTGAQRCSLRMMGNRNVDHSRCPKSRIIGKFG